MLTPHLLLPNCSAATGGFSRSAPFAPATLGAARISPGDISAVEGFLGAQEVGWQEATTVDLSAVRKVPTLEDCQTFADMPAVQVSQGLC